MAALFARFRGVLSAATVSVLLIAIVGCAPQAPSAPDTKMTQRESYEELNSIFVAAKTLLPGEWKDLSGVNPCTLPSGRKGLYYSVTYIGPGVATENQERVFTSVEEAMTAAGLQTTRGLMPGPVDEPITQLSTERTIDRIRYIHFRLAVRTAVFEADSRCVAGDAYIPNEVYRSAHPSAFPKDE